MSGQEIKSGLTASPDAQAALKQRCLSLVRRWHPLAQSGWDRSSARQLGEEIELIADTSERLGLETVNASALELAVYLCSFVDDQLIPTARDLARLADMVNALGAVLTDLSETETADVHQLTPPISLRNEEPAPANPAVIATTGITSIKPETESLPLPVLANPTATPLSLPRTVCLVGVESTLVPGLHAGLSERGYNVYEFKNTEPLLEFLQHTTPGAIVLEAHKLRVMTDINARYRQKPLAPHVLVISPSGDLSHRLLAMRAGAAALFNATTDSLQVIAKLDELLSRDHQPAYRVLLANSDQQQAGEAARWLAERGMTTRLVNDGQSTLSALPEFRPEVVVIDCDLPDVTGIELTQLIRQQQEYAATPIILIGGERNANQRFEAIAAGSDELLIKPVKARHLVTAVVSRAQRAQWLQNVIGTPGNRDAHTGLYSRNMLIEKLEAAIGDRSAGLLFIAIDQPAVLREQIGISGLTALDTHVGTLLRSQLSELDLPAQYQDFHYFVLLHRRSRADITTTAENLRYALANQPWSCNGNSFHLSASIGLALLGNEHRSVDAVVTNAEAAQLAAAHLGGNRVLWFETKEAALLPVDPLLDMRAMLSRPLTPEQASFEFSPIVPLAGKLIGQYELSFKIKNAHHSDQQVAYAELAPIAAECHQLSMLDRWLLEHSLDVRQQQLQRGRQLRLFVPQAVTSLLESEMLWWLTQAMKERHLSGTGLTLELACSAIIDAGSRATERLKALRSQGVRICLIDYGRDWAAVHLLKNIEMDYVRLSPGLVEELGVTPSISDTLLALVRKAHAAGAAVIAPHVDSMARAQMLLRLGVDYAIGPAFARPQAQPEFDFRRAFEPQA